MALDFFGASTGDSVVSILVRRLTRGVILLHDNSRSHTANTITTHLQKFKWEVLSHPPYSPDLSPCDYAIFGPLKRRWWVNDSPRTTTSGSMCGTCSQHSPGNFTRQPFTALCRSGTSASTARANTSDIQVLASVPRLPAHFFFNTPYCIYVFIWVSLFFNKLWLYLTSWFILGSYGTSFSGMTQACVVFWIWKGIGYHLRELDKRL